MDSFERLFGREPTVRAAAPGRVNLIGEHTDYNDGFVLPSAIPQETVVECAAAGGVCVRVASADAAKREPQSYELGVEARGRGWLDYVQGCTRALAAVGLSVGGFDARITSDVPIGSGLSSSAALEVALLRALRQLFGLDLDDVALALAGHRAETELVGARVGIMDQMASSLCDRSTALFLDTRKRTFERVPMPPNAELAVMNSGIAHSHATGGYNTRREECERAAAMLGVTALRDVASDDPRIGALPEPFRRRVRHVVTENSRVLAAVAALRNEDPTRLGTLFVESHESMRDDYEVSLPEIDLLVELATNAPGVFGARLTGGGFGGSIVVLAAAGTAASAAASVASAYADATGRRAAVLVPAGGRG